MTLSLNQVHQGDCLDLMKEIPDGSIDMVLCDLPYEVSARRKWDIIIPFVDLWEAYNRVCKPSSVMVFTATEPFRTKLIVSNIKGFRYDLIWEKNKTTGFLNAKKHPLRKHESILVFYRRVGTYNPQKTTGHKAVNSFTHHKGAASLIYGETRAGLKGGGQTDRYPTSILRFPVVNNDSDHKYHSSQKPVPLFEYLIKTYTNPGETVLDNCAGSGTTGVAARNLGRQFILIEKEPEYVEVIKKRLSL